MTSKLAIEEAVCHRALIVYNRSCIVVNTAARNYCNIGIAVCDTFLWTDVGSSTYNMLTAQY